MRAFYFAFLLMFLSATPISQEDFSFEFIVWNVGQGQWVTIKTAGQCLHFDIGGEKFPAKEVFAKCHDKMNMAYFSHWDLDHIGLSLKAQRLLPRFCLAEVPGGEGEAWKQKYIQFPPCQETPQVKVHELQWRTILHTQKRFKDANHFSRVWVINNHILVSGDSTIDEEKLWGPQLAGAPIYYFVLGHHGSRTSNSEFLLSQLPHLKMGFASARFAKYKHPHWIVVQHFAERHIPLLRTELWGNLIVRLK